MKSYAHHIFVCQGKLCSANGSEKLLEVLRGRLRSEGLSDKIKTSKSGCLGVCKEKDQEEEILPVIVIYPQGVWYQRVTEGDISEIVEQHIKKGKLVERLLYYKMQEL